MAVVALILAIASFVVCPFIPAVVALVVAGKAEQYIRASGGRSTGEGMARAARIVAWVNIGLTVLMVVIVALFAGATVAT